MSFDWTGYLTLSEELAEKDDQTRLRAAASRTYYGIYNICKEHLKWVPTREEGNSVHSAFRNFLSNHPDKKAKEIANQLGSLLKSRINADYENGEVFDKNRVTLNIARAKIIKGQILEV